MKKPDFKLDFNRAFVTKIEYGPLMCSFVEPQWVNEYGGYWFSRHMWEMRPSLLFGLVGICPKILSCEFLELDIASKTATIWTHCQNDHPDAVKRYDELL